jgi:hypothetical protein
MTLAPETTAAPEKDTHTKTTENVEEKAEEDSHEKDAADETADSGDTNSVHPHQHGSSGGRLGPASPDGDEMRMGREWTPCL